MLDRMVSVRDTPTGLQLALPKRKLKCEAAVKYIHCPACKTLMNRKAFGRISGIVVDVCRSHGIWFDIGELAEVIRFVEKGGLERTRQLELEELAERERRLRTHQRRIEKGESLGIEVSSISFNLAKDSKADLATEILQFITELWR